MEVEDCLPAVDVAIKDRSVACACVSESLGDETRPSYQLPRQVLIVCRQVVEGFDVLPWNDKNMGRRLWVAVTEGYELSVLVDDTGRDFTAGDLAE